MGALRDRVGSVKGSAQRSGGGRGMEAFTIKDDGAAQAAPFLSRPAGWLDREQIGRSRRPTDCNAGLSGKLRVAHGVDRLQLRRKVDDSRTCMKSFFWNDCCERPAVRQLS